MNEVPSLQVIARISSDFDEKFGIPRQSGLAPALRATVVFEAEFRNPDCLRGIEGFSHLWLIWQFSESQGWSPTVRPPRLGGNVRMGVFATRAPFRPNPLGLSCVRLEDVRHDPKLGTVLEVSGADLLDGTPIFDIKPYVPYADSHPDALGGFAAAPAGAKLAVEFPPQLRLLLPEDRREALVSVLSLDPRPQYQDDPARVYGLHFAGFDVRFTVAGSILRVQEVLLSKS